MKNFTTVLLGGMAALGMLASGLAFAFWITIPDAPDPASLPSEAAPGLAVDYSEVIEEGRALARVLLSEEKLPGLSLAVAIESEIVWAEGFRWADMESELPVTPETRFRIGGVGTAITAAAVGVLAERGQLDLDAPIQSYVPAFSVGDGPITTRQLMGHTAGIRHHRGESEILRRTPCANDAERLAVFAEDSLRFPPGTDVAYSTYGWVLAGAVVAAAAGEPFTEFVDREVLTPLGMDRTVPEIAGDTLPGTAHFYWPRVALDPQYGVHDSPQVDLSCILPAGGYLSTPSDMVRLGSALMESGLFEAGTIEALFAPAVLLSGEVTGQTPLGEIATIPPAAEDAGTEIVGQGLGESVRRSFLSAVNEGGHVPGGTASFILIPEHRIAIAVATNVSGSANVAAIAAGVAEQFVEAVAGG